MRRDEGCPASDVQDGAGVFVAALGGAGAPEDVVVGEAVAELVLDPQVPARIDVSGLLAIAEAAPTRVASPSMAPPFLAVGWHAFGEGGAEDDFGTRHSA